MTMEEMEKRVEKVIKIINGIEERLDKLLVHGRRNKDFYIIGFVDGLCDFINEELKKVQE